MPEQPKASAIVVAPRVELRLSKQPLVEPLPTGATALEQRL